MKHKEKLILYLLIQQDFCKEFMEEFDGMDLYSICRILSMCINHEYAISSGFMFDKDIIYAVVKLGL